ncbi:MAG: papain-like cysteine protease family protein [Acidobacteriaceae bacterium]
MIPYEKQSDELTGRACGAACLSMSYRSFAKQVPQTEIWPVIAKANRFGQISSTTYLMTQDALKRGFSAVAFQARHPLQALRLSKAAGIRAILNHRVQRDSAAGHYSILVDIDAKEVVVHDPVFGAARRLSHAELIELWLPQVPNSEIAGGVLIAIDAAELPAQPDCEFCRTPMLSTVDCPRCSKPVGLQPGAVLGCINDGCIARMWNWICCPTCDYVFTLKAGAAAGAPAEAQPPAAGTAVAVYAVDLAKLFAELDKFTSHVLSIPAAANDPNVRQKLEFVEATKEQIKVAHAEDLARRASVFGQLAAFEEKIKQQKEAELKKIEDRNAPATPLDGNALSGAMLKNLGFK